jgi:predicted DNA-binding protein YlxM (UPF0122 family)
MKTYCNNDILKAALHDQKEIVKTILETYDLSDEELDKVLKYNSLPQLDKDIIFLTSQMPVSDVANLYGVSRQYIYKLLKKIKSKLL